jgi:hypothetical protein
MTKLSDTQAVILSAASQRADGAVLPLPETLKIRGGAVDRVLGSLRAKGLIEQRGSRRGDNPPGVPPRARGWPLLPMLRVGPGPVRRPTRSQMLP